MRKIHTSWILAWTSIGILAGVLLSLRMSGYFIGLSWLALGLSFIFISLINRRVFMILLVIIGGLLIGLWRGSQGYPSQNIFKEYIGRQVSLSGVVSEDVSLAKSGQAQIKLKEIRLSGQSLQGTVWVSSDTRLDIKRSDVIELSGRLSKGFGSFSASIYKADITKVSRARNGDPALELRDRFSDSTRRALPEPQASLGIGFLTGQHSSLPENLVNDLRILGLTHIIVASGYNLTILVRFARRFLMRISKYTAALGSTLLVVGFTMVAGESPSMMRAAIITGLSLAAWYYGRRVHPLVLIFLSGALTALVNPSYLWGDLGWYLSFAAFLGVLILAPLLLDYFWGDSEPNSVIRLVVETLSAQILTAPIIAFSFGQYAPLALISNVLILPLIPFAMIFTFIAGIGSFISASLAHLIGYPAQALLSYMVFVSEKLASLPAAQGEISFPAPYLLSVYVLIFLAIIFLWRRTRHDFTKDSVIE